MENYTINGIEFKKMLIGGISSLKNNADTVNKLNVFPVPDGDTGSNMVKTLEGGLKSLSKKDINSVGEVINEFSYGVLMGARGNSGVILSQIFKGIQIGINNLNEISAKDLAIAYQKGVKTSYSAVEKPVEGTILTVFREATEYASKNINENSTVVDFYKLHISQAQKTLLKTKEMLPCLKEADVIDSGGAGYLYIVEGMLSALCGEEISATIDDINENSYAETQDYSLFTKDSEMIYGYCTEFILRLQSKKVDVDNFDINSLISKLKEMGGDSIVAYKLDDAVKVHVHIFEPGKVLNECQKYGEFLTLKIENMTLEHTEATKKLPFKKIGIVSVVNGDGLKDLFCELGADVIIDGGQTLNPSSGDFIKAFNEVNAENIIVLPNNSNVYLAAKQAEEIWGKNNVYVIPTKTIQEGYVALSVVNSEAEDINSQLDDIKASLSFVDSIEVTYAVRDAVISGVSVNKGEFMAIHNGELLSVNADEIDACVSAIKRICDDDEKEICTVFIGRNLTKEKLERFNDEIQMQLPDLTVNCYNGGQEVYDFLISLE